MRIVLDTNLLVSALLSDATPPYRLFTAWLDKRFDLVSSQIQLEELRRVTRYPKVRSLLTPAEAGWLINQVRACAITVTPPTTIDVSPDPADNFLLGMAEAGKVNYLATGDKRDVLSLGRWHGTRIVTARQLASTLKV